MPSFELEVSLPVDANALSEALLTMNGVNFELGPWLRMSAPAEWGTKPIYEWPTQAPIFTSRIFFLGFIPIDLHRFRFISVGTSGFEESSSALLNRVWAHQRSIQPYAEGSKVIDQVSYEPKSKLLGRILKPIYRATFAHRHKRLKSKYLNSNTTD